MKTKKELQVKLDEFIVKYLDDFVSYYSISFKEFKVKYASGTNCSYSEYLSWLGRNYRHLEETFRQVEVLAWMFDIIKDYGVQSNYDVLVKYIQKNHGDHEYFKLEMRKKGN
jgi:hypothetical protein